MGLRREDRYRVLIVDHDDEALSATRALLAAHDHFEVVGEASDGVAAVDLAGRLHPDLVVLDPAMPKGDGLAAIPELVASTPGVGLVVRTSGAAAAADTAALDAGAHAVIDASAGEAELIAALTAVAARRSGRIADTVLGDTEEFRRLVVDSLDEGLIAQDESGRVVFANSAALRLLDITEAELLGSVAGDPRWRSVSPDGVSIAAKEHPSARALRTGEHVRDVVMGVTRPGGEVRWMQTSATRVEGPGGRPRGVVVTFTDVTERLETERAQRQADVRFRTAVESMLDGFVILAAVRDEAGKIMDFVCEFVNRAVGAQAGFEPSTIIGRTLLEFAPHLAGAPIFGRLVDVVETGTPADVDIPWYEGIRVQGAFEARLARLDDGIAATFRNVTARKRIEQALQQGEAEIRQVLDAFPHGVGVVDKDRNPLYLNEAGREVLGLDFPLPTTLAELAERVHVERAGTGQPYPVSELPLASALVLGETASVDDVVIRRDGKEVLLETYAVPVVGYDGATKFVVALFSDTTEERERQARLQAALEELARTNEDLGEFAAVAAHDLSAPLRTIAGFVELLGERYGDVLGDDGRGWVDLVVGETAQMRGLIDDLLAYARAGAESRVQVLDLHETATAALAALRVQLDAVGAQVDLGALPTVEGDPTALRQVFQNLLANSLRFRDDAAPLVVSIDARRGASTWIVSVLDNGVGIPTDARTRVFSPFLRAGNQADEHGHGLGLSICRRIIERHGGKIWVEPENTRGTCVSFSLPARADTTSVPD